MTNVFVFHHRFHLIEDLSYEDVKKCYRGSVSLFLVLNYSRFDSSLTRLILNECLIKAFYNRVYNYATNQRPNTISTIKYWGKNNRRNEHHLRAFCSALSFCKCNPENWSFPLECAINREINPGVAQNNRLNRFTLIR